MKDMYSFARTPEEHEELYEKIKQANFKVFERLGIGDQTFLTFASGGSFSQYSHEFQTITDAGEDMVYLDREKRSPSMKKYLPMKCWKSLTAA